MCFISAVCLKVCGGLGPTPWAVWGCVQGIHGDLVSPPSSERLWGAAGIGGRRELAGFVCEEQSSKERRTFGAMWGGSGSPTTAVVYGVWRRVMCAAGWKGSAALGLWSASVEHSGTDS